jgi:hypothetical protein
MVMAASGVVFLAGAVSVFRAFRLPPKALLAGAWMALGWSIFWSVRNISPDLLLAGLVSLALAATVEAMLVSGRSLCASVLKGNAPTNRARRLAIAAGLWWGVAYLAKAVALPFAVLVTASFAVCAAGGRVGCRRELAQRLGLLWLCLALVTAPWITVLSLHYGKFTFSTTGPIAHALAGPGEESRYHPAMVTLHHPEDGRVTQWEEPSRMVYRFWSPLASEVNFRHQLGVMAQNSATMFGWLAPWAGWLGDEGMPPWRRWLGAFDLLGLGAVALALVVGSMVSDWPRALPRRWGLAAVPVVVLGGLYLPFFVMAEDSRYFWPAWPCLWVLAVVGWTRVSREWRTEFRAVLWAFAIPAAVWCGAALRGLPNPAAETARQLAARLQSAGHTGPLAGSGSLPGGRTGLYVAFLLRESWLGDEPQAGPEAFAAAGARVVVMRSDSPQRETFERASGWRAVETVADRPLVVFVRGKFPAKGQ